MAQWPEGGGWPLARGRAYAWETPSGALVVGSIRALEEAGGMQLAALTERPIAE